VAERDVACIFTNTNEDLVKESILSLSAKAMRCVLAKFECNVDRMNILLTQWIKQIVQSRITGKQEDVSNLTTINDIRNGILASNVLNPLINKKKLHRQNFPSWHPPENHSSAAWEIKLATTYPKCGSQVSYCIVPQWPRSAHCPASWASIRQVEQWLVICHQATGLSHLDNSACFLV
jgi:hypothetical protein